MINEYLKKEIISVLIILKEDAQMALNGEWDCTTEEGIQTGFNAQLEIIDNLLNKIENS